MTQRTPITYRSAPLLLGAPFYDPRESGMGDLDRSKGRALFSKSERQHLASHGTRPVEDSGLSCVWSSCSRGCLSRSSQPSEPPAIGAWREDGGVGVRAGGEGLGSVEIRLILDHVVRAGSTN